MDGHLGGDAATLLQHGQILYNKSVHAGDRRVADQLAKLGHFPVRDQGIEGKVHSDTPDMAVFHRLHQRLGGEVLRALAGVEATTAQIYRVGAVLHRRFQRVHGARRGK